MAPRPNLEMAITESDGTIRNILERDACLLVNAGDRIGNVRERRERRFEAAPDRQVCLERLGRILTRLSIADLRSAAISLSDNCPAMGPHLADFIVESRPVLRDVVVQHRARAARP